MAAQIQKTCTTCRVPKPLSGFPKDRTRLDGRYPRCSDCRKLSYLANRDAEVAQQREYNRKNRDKIAQSHKDYAYKRFFFIRANNLKLRHPNELVASFAEIASLWRKQRGHCAVTLRRLNRSNAQLDHITPITKNGVGTIDNLRWVHRDVNYAKRDLPDEEFFQLCRETVAVCDRRPLKGGY